jgi:nitroreductase
MFNIKAPHYLIFNSEEKEGYLENIGFIGQQIDLFLSASGLGTCWLGASKPMDKDDSALSHIICIAFGKPAEPLYRESSEFKRKSLADISEGNDDRLEAARLAPSGMNAQNWYFIADGGKIHCYCKKPNPLLGLMLGKMSSIDLGIAICHIAQESECFSFVQDDSAPVRKGLIYSATVH